MSDSDDDALRTELPPLLARLAVASAVLLEVVPIDERTRPAAENTRRAVADVVAWLNRTGCKPRFKPPNPDICRPSDTART